LEGLDASPLDDQSGLDGSGGDEGRSPMASSPLPSPNSVGQKRRRRSQSVGDLNAVGAADSDASAAAGSGSSLASTIGLGGGSESSPPTPTKRLRASSFSVPGSARDGSEDAELTSSEQLASDKSAVNALLTLAEGVALAVPSSSPRDGFSHE
jgi:hypothetical protein